MFSSHQVNLGEDDAYYLQDRKLILDARGLTCCQNRDLLILELDFGGKFSRDQGDAS